MMNTKRLLNDLLAPYKLLHNYIIKHRNNLLFYSIPSMWLQNLQLRNDLCYWVIFFFLIITIFRLANFRKSEFSRCARFYWEINDKNVTWYCTTWDICVESKRMRGYKHREAYRCLCSVF